MLENQRPMNCLYYIKWRRAYFWLNSSPIIEDEKIKGGMILAEDITESKRVHEELAREKEFLGVTISSILDAVITTDKENNITLINEAAEDLLGYSKEEVEGKKTMDIINLSQQTKTNASTSYILNDEQPQNQLIQINNGLLTNRYQNQIKVEASRAPILNSQGKLSGTVWVIRDITEKQK